MKLSDELRDYSCHIDLNGEDHIVETVRLDRWQRLAAELETELARITNEGTEYAVAYNRGYDDGLKKNAGMFTGESTKLKLLLEENQRLQGENESLLVERRRLEAELAHANGELKCQK